MGGELAVEGRDRVGIHFGAIGGEAPIAIEAGERRVPGVSLLEEFGGFGELRGFGAHDA